MRNINGTTGAAGPAAADQLPAPLPSGRHAGALIWVCVSVDSVESIDNHHRYQSSIPHVGPVREADALTARPLIIRRRVHKRQWVGCV
jgi:hypothetical protein